MNKGNSEMKQFEQAPQARIETKRSFSIIWVVPIVALLIGCWMGLKAWSEKGPVITITFETAEGLEANKTKIKFKDVEIGVVTKIVMNEDLSGVIVTAAMDKNAEKFMREETQFWVVRARVAAGEVSGLGTLFSGAYLGCSPSLKGKELSQFKGLEKPPIITSGMPGRHFVLESESLGSLDVGSPVYYKGIKVGQVVEYDFDELAEAVNIRIFVDAPFDEKVFKNTRFWNASGVNLELDTEGVRVNTQSLVSIMLGGIAFDLPSFMQPLEPANEYRVFRLYDNRKKIDERSYRDKRYFRLYFDQNVRGLVVGAPVEIRGIKLGEVVDIKLEIDDDVNFARVVVVAELEPERLDAAAGEKRPAAGDDQSGNPDKATENLLRLVDRGLRAQLRTGSLLTGQLYVDLDFYAEAPAAKRSQTPGYPELPTLPSPFAQITQRVNNILEQIEKIPMQQIGQELSQTLLALRQTLSSVDEVSGGINRDVLPELKASLVNFQTTMTGVEQTLGPDSPLNYNSQKVMSELSATIRSLRTLIDYLERNPQSVIFGKEPE